jgi:hypothetical protein
MKSALFAGLISVAVLIAGAATAQAYKNPYDHFADPYSKPGKNPYDRYSDIWKKPPPDPMALGAPGNEAWVNQTKRQVETYNQTHTPQYVPPKPARIYTPDRSNAVLGGGPRGMNPVFGTPY